MRGRFVLDACRGTQTAAGLERIVGTSRVQGPELRAALSRVEAFGLRARDGSERRLMVVLFAGGCVMEHPSFDVCVCASVDSRKRQRWRS